MALLDEFKKKLKDEYKQNFKAKIRDQQALAQAVVDRYSAHKLTAKQVIDEHFNIIKLNLTQEIIRLTHVFGENLGGEAAIPDVRDDLLSQDGRFIVDALHFSLYADFNDKYFGQLINDIEANFSEELKNELLITYFSEGQKKAVSNFNQGQFALGASGIILAAILKEARLEAFDEIKDELRAIKPSWFTSLIQDKAEVEAEDLFESKQVIQNPSKLNTLDSIKEALTQLKKQISDEYTQDFRESIQNPKILAKRIMARSGSDSKLEIDPNAEFNLKNFLPADFEKSRLDNIFGEVGNPDSRDRLLSLEGRFMLDALHFDLVSSLNNTYRENIINLMEGLKDIRLTTEEMNDFKDNFLLIGFSEDRKAIFKGLSLYNLGVALAQDITRNIAEQARSTAFDEIKDELRAIKPSWFNPFTQDEGKVEKDPHPKAPVQKKNGFQDFFKRPMIREMGGLLLTLGGGTGLGAWLGTFILPGIGTGIGAAIGAVVGLGVGGFGIGWDRISLGGAKNHFLGALVSAAGAMTAGATIGALAGTIFFPGIGTAIGAGLGAGLGGAIAGFGLGIHRFYTGKYNNQLIGGAGLISFSSTVGGATIGAIVGSFLLPGFGTLVGAGIGAGIGFGISLFPFVVLIVNWRNSSPTSKVQDVPKPILDLDSVTHYNNTNLHRSLGVSPEHFVNFINAPATNAVASPSQPVPAGSGSKDMSSTSDSIDSSSPSSEGSIEMLEEHEPIINSKTKS